MRRRWREPAAIAAAIDRIRSLRLDALRRQWRLVFGRVPPAGLSKDLLGRMIAARLQERAFGGLDPVLRRCLLASGNGAKAVGDQGAGAAPPTALRPGVKLIRSWKGITHHVAVVDGGYAWQDKTYKSLSAIAREITGISWSGPVFFGLKKTNSPSTRVAETDTGASAHG